jgi:hypothetical protein
MKETEKRTPLTEADLLECFMRATNNIEGCRVRWCERYETGLTDAQLEEAVKYELYSLGGGSTTAPGLWYWYNVSGLKIWASRDNCGGQGKPTWEGSATVQMARKVYQIKDPSEAQMSLF